MSIKQIIFQKLTKLLLKSSENGLIRKKSFIENHLKSRVF